MFRTATQNDFLQLAQLWELGFNEKEEDARFVFETFADYDNIFVVEQNEKIIAMLISLPVEIQQKKGKYFYGITTHPDFRGNGVMAGLIGYAQDTAKLQENQFVVLIPQEKSLFEFYEKNDFKTEFFLRGFEHKVKNNVLVKADFDTITANSLRQLRKKFITQPYVQLGTKAEVATVLDMYTQGCFTVETKYGYGIYYKTENTMFFEEIFATDEYQANQILEAARQHSGCEMAKGFVSYGGDMFLGEGALIPFGMFKFLADPFRIDLPYMNMMLN